MESVSRGWSRLVAVVATIGIIVSVALSAADAQQSSQVEKVEGQNLATWIDTLGPRAAANWPDEYGWVWYRTPGKPEGGIEIGFTHGSEHKVAELAKDFPRPDLLHPITVPYSDSQIQRFIDQVIEDRTAAQEGSPPLAATRGRFDIEADVKTGKIEVIIPNSSAEIEASFDKTYNFPVDIREGYLGELAACTSRANCGGQLRAGIKLRNVADPNSYKCSSGFTVWANSKAQILSAAHCTTPDPTREIGEYRWHGTGALAGVALGEVTRLDFDDGVDAERIAIKPGIGFYGRAWIYSEDTDQEHRVESQGSYAALAWGKLLCRAGNTTDRRCGTVQNKYYTPVTYPGLTNFVKMSACSGSGDSGGPVYFGTQAWGIYDGWVDEINGVGGCSNGTTTSFFGAIDGVLAAMNATLVLTN